MNVRTLLLASLIGVSVGCHKGTTTSPSSTTTTTTTTTTSAAASPTTTETFDGRLQVGGSTFFNFDVGQYGTVNASLVNIGGAGVPSSVQVRMGLGTAGDSGCTMSVASLVQTSTVVQVTTTFQPGTYCVVVQDVGNLFADASFNLTVAHP